MKYSAERELNLALPDRSLRGIWKHLGPGIVLMITGVGTSHLITAPTAGGRYEFALLWCIPTAYLLKYYAFEMAFRFTNATGCSILEAYSTAWKKWPLWYVLVTTIVQSAVGQSGRLIAASAVAYFVFSEWLGLDIPLVVYGVILGLASVVMLLQGGYLTVERWAKTFIGVLALSTVLVFLVDPPPLSAALGYISFETPVGSWLLIAALVGLLPTGVDVSLQASEWGKAKKVGLGKLRPELEARGLVGRFDRTNPQVSDLVVDVASLPPDAAKYCREWYAVGIWDFRLGHWVSFVLACMFLTIAAVWIYPSPVEGLAVMGEIARAFTDSVGTWMMLVFALGAFAATYSTAFNYFDGWPRIIAACCRNLFPGTGRLAGIENGELDTERRGVWFSEFNIYRISMGFSLVASILIIGGVPRPVFLVLVASALALFVAPVIFFLNLFYCFKVIPRTDRAFYPSGFATLFGWLSFVLFTGFVGILILERVFGVSIFGM